MKHTQKEHTSSLLFEQQRTLIEELAQKHGILKRRRQIRSIGELLFMLQLVALADTCLRTAAELFSGLFRPIRDSSLYERLCSLQPLLRELLLTLSENSQVSPESDLFVRRLDRQSPWREEFNMANALAFSPRQDAFLFCRLDDRKSG